MKTKIIDILNKIANGEEPPKKILYKCNDEEYIFEYDEYNFDYQNEWGTWLFEDICFDGENHLNKEVEILETTITYKSDKIERLELQYNDIPRGIMFEEQILMYCNNLKYKINEIIDHINEG